MLSLMNTITYNTTTTTHDNKNTQSTKEMKLAKKFIQSNIPTPYGSIPKRNHNKKLSVLNKKKVTNSNNNTPTRKNSLSAPYPCFPLAPTSSSFLLSVFNNLFSKESKEEKPVGFMPCSSDKIQMSQIVDIAVSSSPIDCYHYGNSDGKEQDNCSSISNSSSSSESSTLSGMFSYYMDSFDDDTSNSNIQNNNSINGSCISSEILSDILCDHYVQTQMNCPPSSSDDDVVMDVPLETFRMFEAPNGTTTATIADDNTSSNCTTAAYDNWMSMDELDTKEWKLIETKHEIQQKKQEIIVQIKKEEDIPPVETDDISPVTIHHHARDIRANAAYLRMIVAEVNMMRSQKIVGPLRPRRVLPKRLDNFMYRPSPLLQSSTIIAA